MNTLKLKNLSSAQERAIRRLIYKTPEHRRELLKQRVVVPVEMMSDESVLITLIYHLEKYPELLIECERICDASSGNGSPESRRLAEQYRHELAKA